MKGNTLISFLLVLYSLPSFSQNSDFLGLAAHYGFIFAHSEAVQNTKGSYPFGTEIYWTKFKTDSLSFNICNCSPRNNLSIVYFDYDKQILGKGISLTYSIEPSFYIFNKTFFLLKGTAGISALNRPYNSITNNSNMSYSTVINGYLGISPGLLYNINERWNVLGQLNYLHISNGGIKDPNKGINWPTASLGVEYSFKNDFLIPGKRNFSRNMPRNKETRIDISSFVSSKTIAVGEKERFVIYGLGISASRQINYIHGFCVGMEAYEDLSLKERLHRDNLEGKSSIRVGISLGHEFLLGKFVFSQQLGYYIFNQTTYFYWFYHRWGLMYSITDKIAFGINLKAHLHQANFIDFRLNYTIKSKK